METKRSGAVALVCAALCACGGDDAGGKMPGTLKTKADVLRELGNLDLFPAPVFAAKSMGRGGFAAHQPRPESVYDCDSGSGRLESDAGQRTLTLFGVTEAMDYYIFDDDQCFFDESDDSGTYTFTYDGYEEAGDNYFIADEGEPEYRYEIYGSGGGFRSEMVRESTWSYIERLRGRIEQRQLGDFYETRYALEEDYDQNDFVSFHFRRERGTMSEPLVTTMDASADEAVISIDGSLSYESRTCVGGTFEFETVQPLHYGEGSASFEAGTLMIRRDDAEVTVSFNSDGSAQLTFGDGSSGTLRRGQIREARGCFAPPGL